MYVVVSEKSVGINDVFKICRQKARAKLKRVGKSKHFESVVGWSKGTVCVMSTEVCRLDSLLKKGLILTG